MKSQHQEGLRVETVRIQGYLEANCLSGQGRMRNLAPFKKNKKGYMRR
jgi:hypothetical protein